VADLIAILEIDSVELQFTAAQWKATLARHALLESAGYSVIHLPPSALRDEKSFVHRVSVWLDARRDLLYR
jgi:hypothetical protein